MMRKGGVSWVLIRFVLGVITIGILVYALYVKVGDVIGLGPSPREIAMVYCESVCNDLIKNNCVRSWEEWLCTKKEEGGDWKTYRGVVKVNDQYFWCGSSIEEAPCSDDIENKINQIIGKVCVC